MFQRNVWCAAAAAVVASCGSAFGAPVSWANWTSATSGLNGAASGSIALDGGASVGVSYAGEVASPTQVNGGGTNYWRSDAAYRSANVPNGPGESGNTDIIALVGQNTNQVTNTIRFATPVTDPIMAILSLGRGGLATTYAFNADFQILSSGSGFFGGSAAGSLFRDGPGLLRGVEGHGVIRFSGTFASISFTSTAENWHGFQVGIIPGPGGALVLAAAGMLGGRRRR